MKNQHRLIKILACTVLSAVLCVFAININTAALSLDTADAYNTYDYEEAPEGDSPQAYEDYYYDYAEESGGGIPFWAYFLMFLLNLIIVGGIISFVYISKQNKKTDQKGIIKPAQKPEDLTSTVIKPVEPDKINKD